MPLRKPIADTEFLKKARERWKHGDTSDDKQAQRERDDISFEDGNQWPEPILNLRQAQQSSGGMPAIPARPSLVVDKIRPSVRQILNQERESSIGVEITPADDFGDLGLTPDDTEITLREGLVRRIQRESKAADARSWAFKRAVIAGRGFYLVMTRFLPGKTMDQEVYVHRIYNQSGVILDPSHEQPDGSDADWEFMGGWCPWDRFSEEHPQTADGKDNPFAEASESDFTSMQEEYPDWYQSDGDERAVRVVDYWYTEREARELAVTADGQVFWAEELPPGVKAMETRTVIEKHIKFCKIGGGVVELEKTDWAGPDMPIIKVVGEEILPYDGERRAEGMVRPSRDAQRGLNYTISRWVEDMGATVLTPLMVDPEAVDGFEEFFKQSTTRTFPFLPYRSYDDQGRPLNPPTRPPKDNNPLGLMQGIALFNQAIDSTTAVTDTARGQADPSVKSARHARFLIDESRLGTSNFLDNLMRSVRYEAQVQNGLLYAIYGAKPGRLLRAITGVGEAERYRIADTDAQQQHQQLEQKAIKVAKLTKDAHFNVAVKITKNFATRREQIVGILGEVVGANPEQMGVVGDILYESMDLPEHKEMAERQRVMLAPAVQALLAAKEKGQTFDPAAQAQIAQMQQQLQHAEAAIKELAEIAHGKTAEINGKLQVEQLQQSAAVEKARIEADRDLKLQQMKDATSLAIAHLNAETKGVISAHTAEDEAIALDKEQAHEAVQAELDRQHERESLVRQQAHDAATGAGEQDFQGRQADADRQQAQIEQEPSE